ncbi:small acid soluble protein [Paenibacillus vortex V453]|uniref:Small acid soluble protein n=1 Tax=Paenibacillus vortex V453 TaxID=715225 RepID=A0A2R9T2U8_9BACL|nr:MULTISPECIES: alpha/beta-type small acid-soluble spore protein [Paenibacillus]EFU43884.1 small acid soluble protein [Paenibacillus vortex V453]MDH6673690.1 small acid-soluble spore protein D (minor alpha/beta-type SASP) [Paenibacillus sp. LBL]
MARRSRRHRSPEMQQFMTKVMQNEGYKVDPQSQEDVKYEVAKSLGVPLKPGSNGDLTTEQAGKVGGAIGGSMVREMVRMAQESLSKR